MGGAVPVHCLLGGVAAGTPNVDTLNLSALVGLSGDNHLGIIRECCHEILQEVNVLGVRVI
jgi:hypothetical protein